MDRQKRLTKFGVKETSKSSESSKSSRNKDDTRNNTRNDEKNGLSKKRESIVDGITSESSSESSSKSSSKPVKPSRKPDRKRKRDKPDRPMYRVEHDYETNDWYVIGEVPFGDGSMEKERTPCSSRRDAWRTMLEKQTGSPVMIIGG